MIDIVFIRKKGMFIGFEVSGHAEFARYGKDIVCASVSILTQNCVNAIIDILKAKAEFEQDDKGYAKIYVTDDDKIILDKADLLIASMAHGINWIAENYPKYVKVTSKEVKS